MGFITLLILSYIIYLIYKSHRELFTLFSGNKQESPFKPSGKKSGQVKDDILNGNAEYVDFEEIDEENTKG